MTTHEYKFEAQMVGPAPRGWEVRKVLQQGHLGRKHYWVVAQLMTPENAAEVAELLNLAHGCFGCLDCQDTGKFTLANVALEMTCDCPLGETAG